MEKQNFKPLPANVISIAFVGGAHVGKSATFKFAVDGLNQTFSSNPQVRIFVGKEAADAVTSMRRKCGLELKNKGLSYQFEVLAFQVGVFEEAIEYARSHPSEYIIVLNDRTMLDSYSSYLSGSEREALNYTSLERYYDKFYYFEFNPMFLSDSKADHFQHRYESTMDDYLKLSDESTFTYLHSGLVAPDKVEVVLPFPTLEAKTRAVTDRVLAFIRWEIKRRGQNND